MSTINKLKFKIKELRDYTAGNTNLEVKINSAQYPVSVTFYEKQIDMFSEDVTDAPPKLCFIFNDETQIVTDENFTIGESVFNKLKNLSKAINLLYLHAFREEIEKIVIPLWDTVDGSQMALYRKREFDRLMREIDIL